MLKGLRRFAMAAALLAAPVAAQDAPQSAPLTVEGAQEFLRRMTAQFDMSNLYAETIDYYSAHTKMRFEPVSRCMSKLSYEYKWRHGTAASNPQASNEENWEAYKRITTAGASVDDKRRMLEGMEASRFPTQVDWSSVSSVAVISIKPWAPHGYGDDTKRVVQVLYGGNRGFAMFAPDAAMAARIGYAMEFLRSACDAAGDTGF